MYSIPVQSALANASPKNNLHQLLKQMELLMQKEMWKEVFKAGKHKDASGNEREWTEEDLEEIVVKYNNQSSYEKHEAPVVIGHPVNNSPAYAWVEELKKDGDTLLAKFNQLDPEFEELIKEGRYKKVSIALYPDMMLRHVGYLGAIPPAVKGLKDSEFNLKQEFLIFEIEQNVNSASTVFQQNGNDVPTEVQQCSNSVGTKSNKGKEIKVKKKKIYSSPSKSGNFEGGDNLDTKQKIINFQGGVMNETLVSANYSKLFQELLGWLGQTFNEEIANQTAEELEKMKTKYLKSPDNPNSSNEGTEANDSVQSVEVSQSKEFQELQRKLEKLESDNREMKFNEYFKSQLGRLLPAQKQIVKLAFESVKSNSEGYQFSENGKMISLNGEELIKKLIESFPVQVEFNEVARKDLYGEADSLEEQNKFIDEYYKSN